MRYIIIMLLVIALISCSEVSDNGNEPEANDVDSVAIASFNIQVFGQSKMEETQVMDYIVQIIRKYDGVAIQEIRSAEQDVMPRLVDMLGENWDFVISGRLGRTVSKEQYSFVYRTDKITVDSTYQTYDPDDQIHREPYVIYAVAGNFDFSLIIIHTDPDEVPQEVDFLDNLYIEELAKEPDALLLGDLNADPTEFGELLDIANINWVVKEGTPTNTRETETYDNILYVSANCKEYLFGGVLNFMTAYNLNLDNALEISDHFPVFAVFDVSQQDDD